MAANPHTGKDRTATQLDALAQKLARAGNYSKSCQERDNVVDWKSNGKINNDLQSCQAVCSDPTQSLGSQTLAKLQAKNPQGSLDFDKTFWPSTADMDTLRQEDDWRRAAEEHFSVDNVRKCFARSPPLSAQDADG